MSDSGLALLPFRFCFKLAIVAVQILFFLYFFYAAYSIRLYPIKDFGMIIHEFDPWFNYRATEYLAENGLAKFFKWYDYESWYPLGRPIGTTIYPGMQMTAVAIWEGMKRVPAFTYDLPEGILALGPLIANMKKSGFMHLPKLQKSISFAPMSVNDICCMIPPWFGSIASLFTGLLTYEISRSVNAALMAVGIMAIIPAHLMRSVGGEFDNEAVAVAAICSTFWLWLRSVRNPSSWPFGLLAGVSYGYMVAAWGGYIFVLNMIGVHALMLVGLGRFNSGVHRAYTLFFVVGTSLAIQIPVVGWQPLRSLEQLGPLGVFLGVQVLEFCDIQRRMRANTKRSFTTMQFVRFRIQVILALLVAVVATACMLYPTGYFGPLSARIRGLFVKHTKTGNPLVDSVAEHQPANQGMYASYLNLPLDYALLGGLVSFNKRNNGFYFMALYGFIAQHFSGKMSRLVLICGPITSIACAIWCGFLLDFLLEPFLLLLGKKPGYAASADDLEKKDAGKDSGKKDGKDSGKKDGAKDSGKKDGKAGKAAAEAGNNKAKKGKKGDAGKLKFELQEYEAEERPGGMMQIKRHFKTALWAAVPEEQKESYHRARVALDHHREAVFARAATSMLLVAYVLVGSGLSGKLMTFVKHSDRVARSLSNPQVVYKVQGRDGKDILVDDYLKGYQWIDQNTPKDSRVMAWWDYGYQITGIAKRTSIADGNTWNHEHIATLGRTLTSPEKRAWNVIRHLADYVLVWAGGGGDDLAKSPHLARIGNSVFPEHCGDDDPKCDKFSFYSDHSPTPMMARSLLYKLCMADVTPGVRVNERLFKEVHTTKHGLMRVFKVMNVSQESKAWVADPKNRICDAPGSWYCVGQYPPALEKLIAKRRNFAQLEDFNKGTGGKSAYTKMIEKERGGGSSSADL
eukprot:CAMPEP_0204523326 /NCGR_PEP_ID=MMETSP0661-20131031/6784_1 /ASSEMBLY_ACC=CAM_ASM_000606 /TAXON_ID=109239 /ORGANISM="Alexandrium margalefi, Strain AMGDE01CS-322" /LENGTH=909 /DNA_ID=CAMNT_0051529025 /DNA_START=67 /DNA_END=2796 /DNA_ORIENTATION=+